MPTPSSNFNSSVNDILQFLENLILEGLGTSALHSIYQNREYSQNSKMCHSSFTKALEWRLQNHKRHSEILMRRSTMFYIKYAYPWVLRVMYRICCVSEIISCKYITKIQRVFVLRQWHRVAWFWIFESLFRVWDCFRRNARPSLRNSWISRPSLRGVIGKESRYINICLRSRHYILPIRK